MTARPIVVLTGAGISRESGLHTFRDVDGIWNTVHLEDVATPEAFRRDPARVYEFYNARRRAVLDPAVQPNAAHLALTRLEREHPAPVLVVTQNVDDLHDRAGTQALLHMHGELLKARCLRCTVVSPSPALLSAADVCPACGMTGGMRPDVVWFGEMPMHMNTIEVALEGCGLFVSIGTSGSVYPAAGFVREARSAGAHTVELNLEPSDGSTRFHERLYGPATEVVPAFVERVLAVNG